MSYTIKSAAYANADHTAAIVDTEEAAAVLLSAKDTPRDWAAMLAWGEPDPFTLPPPPVPQAVTPRQARLALLAAGLLDDVNAAVAAAGPQAQIDWDYALEIRRDNALIASMAGQLNLSSKQIDDLFRAAAVL